LPEKKNALTNITESIRD